MYRKDNKSKIITSLVLVLVLTLSIGFAAFSNTLRITPQATITPDSATFDIDFSSVSTGVVASNITPSLTGTGLTAEAARIDNSTNPTISNLSVNFTKPGQKAEYKFYAYNNGEYLAYLNSVNFLNAEGKDAFKTCEAVESTTQYVDGACMGIKVSIKVGSLTTDKTESNITKHSLARQTAEEIIVTIEYEENSAVADGAFNVTFGDITLVYTSVDGTGIAGPEPEEPDSYAGASPCTFDGELTQGAEYVNGQYTYRYIEAQNGWKVVTNDLGYTNYTSQLCSSVNNKPIVSMADMFNGAGYGGQSTVYIDVSSFDTSNVIDMSGMFSAISTGTLDLSSFDTSKVTNMSTMFGGAQIGNLDLSSFDTSHNPNISAMFAGTQVTNAYARNDEEAAKFNNSEVTFISGFTFTVK